MSTSCCHFSLSTVASAFAKPSSTTNIAHQTTYETQVAGKIKGCIVTELFGLCCSTCLTQPVLQFFTLTFAFLMFIYALWNL
jgi:hypothetical protein